MHKVELRLVVLCGLYPQFSRKTVDIGDRIGKRVEVSKFIIPHDFPTQKLVFAGNK